MSGETKAEISGWTVDTLKILQDERVQHYAELRQAEEKFQGERDRRYLEVNIEKEKALKIKETADLAALSLAREIQDYKDEKANNLRSQIEGERGQYATKDDLANVADKLEAIISPVAAYVTTQQGALAQQERDRERKTSTDRLTLAIAGLLLTAAFFTITQLTKVQGTPTTPTPVTITVVAPTPTPHP